MPKVICLLSGGLDSTTALYAALNEGCDVTALTIHYGQLHHKEIEFAKETALRLSLPHFMVPVTMPWKGSALLDSEIPMPLGRDEKRMAASIPSTYVPARNSVFLTLAASCAEAVGARSIFIGANILDYSGYPDCRPEYFEAFEAMIQLGTKAGVQGELIEIKVPLLYLNKKEIIQLGQRLGVPFESTWSCYQGKETPCGQCDSCLLRAKGFQEAGILDSALVIASEAKQSQSLEIASSPTAPCNDDNCL